MAIEIGHEILNALLGAAAEAPGREVCGLLFGSERRIDRAEPAENVADHPRDTFEIDPKALFEALRAERAGGPRLIGHYHSHPNGSAEPSARDRAAAEPGKYWLILGGGVARLWLAGQGGFTEVQMIVNQDRAWGG
jgi:proteasome lid subunit RPN8/RPN11